VTKLFLACHKCSHFGGEPLYNVLITESCRSKLETFPFGIVVCAAVVVVAPSWMTWCSNARVAVTHPKKPHGSLQGGGLFLPSLKHFWLGGVGGACLNRFPIHRLGWWIATALSAEASALDEVPHQEDSGH
jgi:hypothetical protein